jgi:hypothetical protein
MRSLPGLLFLSFVFYRVKRGLTLIVLAVLFVTSANAQLAYSGFDQLWSKARLYSGGENSPALSVAFT